jgi:hypothetical protein
LTRSPSDVQDLDNMQKLFLGNVQDRKIIYIPRTFQHLENISLRLNHLDSQALNKKDTGREYFCSPVGYIIFKNRSEVKGKGKGKGNLSLI